MTKQEVYDEFKYIIKGSNIDSDDYCEGQLAFASFIDGLAKDNQITDRQANSILPPFNKNTYKSYMKKVCVK